MNRFHVTSLRDATLLPEGEIALVPSSNLVTGERDLRRRFPTLTTLEADLLVLAAAIFAADRGSLRGQREDVCRHFNVRLPVANAARIGPVIPLLERALHTLSNDSWTLVLDDSRQLPEERVATTKAGDITLLFSGGLDSLAAAIEFGRAPVPLQLVSHITRNRVIDLAQEELAALLQANGYNVAHHQVFVSSRTRLGLVHDVENSQRTRSFVFLVLGALVARRTESFDLVYLAENGQMAIHLPLTSARVSAFSTHTAHPDVLADMQTALSEILDVPIRIINPYVHRTKAEVVAPIIAALPQAVRLSNSCWKSARLPAGINHCGECVPCLERRIAISSLTADSTFYLRDLFAEDFSQLEEDDEGRRNLYDLVEFVVRMAELPPEAVMSEWPDLYSRHIDANAVIAMYKRFAADARAVLSTTRVAGGLFA